MIWRHELKYLIDQATFRELYYTLRTVLHHDSHVQLDESDPEQPFGYQIRSLYFDDHGRRGIFDKLAGTDPRHKYRIRIYNDGDQVIRLEKKIKFGAMTCKESCLLSRDQVDSLLDNDPEFLIEAIGSAKPLKSRRTDLLGQFYGEWRTRHLRPLVLVEYNRIPLVWPDGNVRITFDRNLSTGYYRQDIWDPGAALQPVLDEQSVILEVKFDRFIPEFIQQMLPLAGAIPLAMSKYTQCAAYCRSQSWEDQI